MKTNRRQFLCATAGGTAVIALRESLLGAAEPAASAEVQPGRFTIHAYDAKGERLPESALQGLFLFEAGGDRNPLPQPKRDVSRGCVSLEAPAAPFGCSLLTNVDGFGTVRLYADADGKGYRAGQDVVLNRELASSRLAALDKTCEQARQEGAVLPPSVTERMEKARSLLRQADLAATDPKRATPLAMASLRELLWAGEEVVLARARQSISRRGPRKDFLFGPEHDLFEIARMLDRFSALGKPLHVTELGVSSRADRDEQSMGKDPSKSYWHEPWSERVQADWIEQFYTLCYAHPAMQAVTWWDFSDAGGHFWPHGGFLRPDGQPKEGYHRLQRLIRGWTGA